MVDLSALTPLIIGPLASLAVNAAERLPIIPFEARTKASIVLALLVVSLGVRLALAATTGELATINWESEIKLVLDAIMAVFVAAGGYSLVQSDKALK